MLCKEYGIAKINYKSGRGCYKPKRKNIKKLLRAQNRIVLQNADLLVCITYGAESRAKRKITDY